MDATARAAPVRTLLAEAASQIPEQLASAALELTEVLRSLTVALPVAAILMDSRGRVLWMNRQAESRLEHAGRASRRGPLEELARSVREPGTRPRWLEAHEALVVRGVGGCGEGRALVSLVPRAAQRRSAPSAEEVRAALSLSVREAEIALLAAQGFSVLNIACRLGVAESTVRTYLKRVYGKTGVHSRAELACRIFDAHEAREDAAMVRTRATAT